MSETETEGRIEIGVIRCPNCGGTHVLGRVSSISDYAIGVESTVKRMTECTHCGTSFEPRDYNVGIGVQTPQSLNRELKSDKSRSMRFCVFS
jgi:hypothetical protein